MDSKTRRDLFGATVEDIFGSEDTPSQLPHLAKKQKKVNATFTVLTPRNGHLFLLKLRGRWVRQTCCTPKRSGKR
jgi:hypothetical protein